MAHNELPVDVLSLIVRALPVAAHTRIVRCESCGASLGYATHFQLLAVRPLPAETMALT